MTGSKDLAQMHQDRERIAQESAMWRSRLADTVVSAADKKAFDDWLSISPVHQAEYDKVDVIWNEAASLQSLAEMVPVQPDNRTIWERMRIALHNLKPLPAGTGGAGQPSGGGVTSLSRPLAVSAMAFAVFALVVLVPFSSGPDVPHSYITGKAEVLDLSLQDGSQVSIGAKTALSVNYTDDERRVKLDAGSAFFEIESDTGRPFYVETDKALIRVTGTKFNVQLDESRFEVTVQEGSVQVTPASIEPVGELLADAAPKILTKGQRIRVRGDVVEPVQAVAATSASAWRSGLLVYENAVLSDVVADANRYSEKPIKIADSSLGNVQVLVSFRVDQIDQLIETLDNNLPLSVSRGPEGAYILQPE